MIDARKREIPSTPPPPPTILMADDDEEDCELARKIMSEIQPETEMRSVENGEQLMDYLHGRGRFAAAEGHRTPSLILLDLNMPLKSGWEALHEIKADDAFRHIPVVILTTSVAPEDVRAGYALGACSYITKPTRYTTWKNAMQTLGRYWFGTVVLPEPHEQDTLRDYAEE